ncbi:MAG: hypothetical protein ACM3NQ_10820 [Bacteroidales bacterium]
MNYASVHVCQSVRAGIGHLLTTTAIVFGMAGVVSAQSAAGQAPGPLSRAHRALDAPDKCQTCHGPDNKVPDRGCLACHKPIADRIAARRGVHKAASGCAACHTEHGGADTDLRPLDPASFDHTETGFALVGRHGEISRACERCHKTRSYLTLRRDCSACHDDAHNGARGAQCGSCHTPTAPFRNVGARFEHAKSGFTLEGRHLAVDCASCHMDGVTKGTPTRCYDCHWVRRQDDRYRTQLGSDCGACHRPASWIAVNWNHETGTGVRLNAIHRTLRCDSCHTSGTFQAVVAGCATCHAADYARAANPNHAAAGFPTTCDACHRPSHASWSQAAFNHSGVFPLVGVHAAQPCASCHRNSVYRGTTRTCFGCHQADYQRTQNPNHVAGGFSTACDTCHRPTDPSFKGAAFSHTAFALAGVHATQPCTACHKNGVFKGTSRVCFGCHQADYQRAANPNHVGAGFPTACDACHRFTDASWSQAVFNHTYFPITSGRHNASCSTCHVESTNYKVFSCFACHDRGSTDAKHVGRAGYRYDSVACYSCHPRG